MAEQAYHRTCLVCGATLQPNAHGPETAPWRCDICCRSYWVAELTQEGRRHFRREQRDFGWGGTPGEVGVRTERDAEVREARARGVSLRREQLGLVSRDVIERLLARHHGRIGSKFEAEMRRQVGE